MDLGPWAFTIIPLTIVGILVFLLFMPIKRVSKSLPAQSPKRGPYSRPGQKLSGRGLIISLTILGLAYYLGSKKYREKGG